MKEHILSVTAVAQVFPGGQKIAAVVVEFDWDIDNEKPSPLLNADVNKLIATTANILYAIYDAKTVLPDDGKECSRMAHHSRGWEITYDIEAIRDWLLCQAR